ncbi:hypothetical protein QAD02_022398 [Eretmocerus hayati]|uniref:Uncharacterized protein n=1 Tax=Eretmocerus hayati TaxID=131215 RepID=A0ACC2PSQ2_9HYME|nr:hypothetical protein QAD02_022398 [Eretmocerus hayati]
MASSEVLIILAILVIAISSNPIDKVTKHHGSVARSEVDDGVMYREFINEINRDPRKILVVTRKLRFPNYNVTHVRIEDRTTKGESAKVTLIRGGPGTDQVHLEFTGQNGGNVTYLFEVYGKKQSKTMETAH